MGYKSPRIHILIVHSQLIPSYLHHNSDNLVTAGQRDKIILPSTQCYTQSDAKAEATFWKCY